jgi:hypothetical protein
MSKTIIELQRNSIYAVGNEITILDKEEFNETKRYDMGSGFYLEVDFNYFKTHKRYHFGKKDGNENDVIFWLAVQVEADRMPYVSPEVKLINFATVGIRDYKKNFRGIDRFFHDKKIVTSKIIDRNINYEVYKKFYDKARERECPNIEFNLRKVVKYLKNEDLEKEIESVPTSS